LGKEEGSSRPMTDGKGEGMSTKKKSAEKAVPVFWDEFIAAEGGRKPEGITFLFKEKRGNQSGKNHDIFFVGRVKQKTLKLVFSEKKEESKKRSEKKREKGCRGKGKVGIMEGRISKKNDLIAMEEKKKSKD